jgi:hypothetical protein
MVTTYSLLVVAKHETTAKKAQTSNHTTWVNIIKVNIVSFSQQGYERGKKSNAKIL